MPHETFALERTAAAIADSRLDRVLGPLPIGMDNNTRAGIVRTPRANYMLVEVLKTRGGVLGPIAVGSNVRISSEVGEFSCGRHKGRVTSVHATTPGDHPAKATFSQVLEDLKTGDAIEAVGIEQDST